MSTLDSMAENVREKRRLGAYHAIGLFKADHRKYISQVRDDLEKFSDRYYGSGDYIISDILEKEKLTTTPTKCTVSIIFFISGLMAVIGLSNVWATISGT